ncbi:hypothetical protein PIB19_16680 [Sphingomonas sp. 7/4-4]|uniref:hypothetical protein n=1 Tax=Sphingomonas sp. 7/4-4 TaxID=3018446 RepID=UPI0022F3F9A5|nr:hypothetical protein [Sphingomonas sp. 7/4-4]WBY07058.1 hypothetical protein PIB19_16680 [Sphingomonas sp. 7/4-4]
MLITAIDAIAREATLFAAIWFLVGGLDDLLVDLIYAARRVRLRLRSLPQRPLFVRTLQGRFRRGGSWCSWQRGMSRK